MNRGSQTGFLNRLCSKTLDGQWKFHQNMLNSLHDRNLWLKVDWYSNDKPQSELAYWKTPSIQDVPSKNIIHNAFGWMIRWIPTVFQWDSMDSTVIQPVLSSTVRELRKFTGFPDFPRIYVIAISHSYGRFPIDDFYILYYYLLKMVMFP